MPEGGGPDPTSICRRRGHMTTSGSARSADHEPPAAAAPRLRLRQHPVGSRATARVVEAGDAGASALIPIARCYEGRLARLELAGAARREQAVAAAAAVDGGAAAEGHLAAGAEAMVVEAFLPGPDGGGTTASSSTRVVSTVVMTCQGLLCYLRGPI